MKKARPQGGGSGERSRHHGLERRCGTRVGMMPRPRRWFRAPARCRPEAGGQFSRWGPAVARHPALDGYTPRRESSRRLGSAPPRPCGPLCRAPPGELPRGRRSPAGAPPSVDGAWPRARNARAKTAGSELCSLPTCPGGKCERGARPPFTKRLRPIGTCRRPPTGGQGSFDCRRGAPGGSGAGAQCPPTR